MFVEVSEEGEVGEHVDHEGPLWSDVIATVGVEGDGHVD